ncbi:hypothetical protein Adt_09790 [Abeliophyllum distichum]|uniref:Uncharacterized protein n=1 Tax=Abeliophyllum distichum TaxID=126358 RepID=A0ABD1UIE4_9LAMI
MSNLTALCDSLTQILARERRVWAGARRARVIENVQQLAGGNGAVRRRESARNRDGCGRRFRAQKSRLRANNHCARVIARRRTARRRKWSCSPASTVGKPTDFVRAVRATESPKRGDCFGAQEKRTV